MPDFSNFWTAAAQQSERLIVGALAFVLAAILAFVISKKDDWLRKLEEKSIHWGSLAAMLCAVDIVLWIAVLAGPPTPWPKAEWMAASELAANTRLTESNLVKPRFPNPLSAQGLPKSAALVGKYLRFSRHRGEPIDERRVTGAPVIREHKNEAILFLPAQSLGAAAARLNAGGKVYLCEEGKPCTDAPLYVEAVIGEGASAQVALRVRQQDVGVLRGLAKPVLVLASIPP